MPVVAFTHFINIGPAEFGTFPDPGGTLSWTGGLDVPSAVEVDSGPDGLLSTGGEDVVADVNPYSGYTVEFNGETYAIFSATNGTLVIPYNKDVYDIGPQATGSNTATYMPTNAMHGLQLLRHRNDDSDAGRRAGHRDAATRRPGHDP